MYGIVRADDLATDIAVQETRIGQHHSRGSDFFDGQHDINGHIGVPTVLHGAQEGRAAEHSDEGIDILHPDGVITGAENHRICRQALRNGVQRTQAVHQRWPREVVRDPFVSPS